MFQKVHFLIISQECLFVYRMHYTVLLGWLSALQVGDFGLSRIKRNTLVSGGVRGTLPWMAPELLNGSSNRVSEKVRNLEYNQSLLPGRLSKVESEAKHA